MTVARRPRLPAPTLSVVPAQGRHAQVTLRMASRDGVAGPVSRRDSLRAGPVLVRRGTGAAIDPVLAAPRGCPRRRDVQTCADQAPHAFQAGRQ